MGLGGRATSLPAEEAPHWSATVNSAAAGDGECGAAAGWPAGARHPGSGACGCEFQRHPVIPAFLPVPRPPHPSASGHLRLAVRPGLQSPLTFPSAPPSFLIFPCTPEPFPSRKSAHDPQTHHTQTAQGPDVLRCLGTATPAGSPSPAAVWPLGAAAPPLWGATPDPACPPIQH